MKNILYNLGRSYQSSGDNNKAMGFYKKVMNSPPNDDLSKKAKKSYDALSGQG
jgi:hypothetical protein